MLSKEQLINAIASTRSMSAAAAFLNVHYGTFRKYAMKYDLWCPNQSGKGLKKAPSKNAVPLNEILSGKHRGYARKHLKRRLIKHKILDHTQCAICKHPDVWNNKTLIMQLDHIDGDAHNHKLENLRFICPNCHTQTQTFSCKKRLGGGTVDT